MNDCEPHSRRPAPLVATLLVVAALATPRPAHANDAALAEELYELGRKLMAAGRIAEACPRFVESERLDPATGTLLNLATCHESEGKLATAWAEFQAAGTAARHDERADRERYAHEHIAAIEPRLSYLRVVVDPASRVEGLEVKLDQSKLGAASWGVAAPIDPGRHEVSAHVPGGAQFFERVVITATPQQINVTVAFARAASAVPVGEVTAVGSAAQAVSETRPRSSARVAGGVALGVSAAALIVGVTFGVRARSKWDARNAQCDANDACSPPGLTYGKEAQTAASVADVAFGVAVVGLGTAGYLLLVRHEPPAPTTAAARLLLVPSASSTAGGLALRGTW